METVGRVFTGVALPPEMRMALADRIGGMAIPGRVVPPANWHLTLRFLGSVDPVTYERFLSAVAEVEAEAPFTIGLAGFGAFPNVGRATVFWAGVNDGQLELARLSEITEEAAQSAGLAPEERPYRAHLTLSRIRPPADVGSLIDHELGLSWRCREVVVFRSHPGRGGVTYEPLETFGLRG